MTESRDPEETQGSGEEQELPPLVGVVGVLGGILLLAALVLAVDPLRSGVGDALSGDTAELRSDLHGLGVEMAEAMAEYVHKRIRAELGFAAEDDREVERMLKQHYRGSRYSFGYPACPTLSDQRQLLRLLGAERIGLELSDEDQLHPEQSTSAIVVVHPQAKYFSV